MKSISIFLISIFINTFAYGDLEFNKNSLRCVSKEKTKVLVVKLIKPDTKPLSYSGITGSREQGIIEEIELRPYSTVKCIYEVEYKTTSDRFSIDEAGKNIKYSAVCANILGDINYIDTSNYLDNPPGSGRNGSALVEKYIRTMYPTLRYVWQKGECSDLTEKYYNKIKIKTTEEKLIKNKFMLVNENEKYLSYYGNPGYFVKLEKNNKCKNKLKCELNVLVKRYFRSAILDAAGKLYTVEEIF